MENGELLRRGMLSFSIFHCPFSIHKSLFKMENVEWRVENYGAALRAIIEPSRCSRFHSPFSIINYSLTSWA